MRFYTGQHLHYCGVNLHAKAIYSASLIVKAMRPAPQPNGLAFIFGRSSADDRHCNAMLGGSRLSQPICPTTLPHLVV